MRKTILLVDMNAFFASVEQQSNPLLRGKPVLVAGSPNSRSVVSAASYEARKFGVHSAMSLPEAMRLCPSAIVIEGDPAKYVNTSMRLFQIFRDYTDQMEIYSVDECFLDVTSTQHLFGGPVEIAKAIKRRMRRRFGLTCSVGIAQNKMLAKLAAGMQKPDGLVEIRPEQVRETLENLPVEKLHGIGEKTREQLAYLGVMTAGQLGRYPREALRKKFGIIGDLLHEMGNGIDRNPIVPYHSQPDVKSIGHTYTLPHDTHDPESARRHLLRLSEMVGRRLRDDGFSGRTVTVTIRYDDMQTITRRRTLPEYLEDGYAIYQVALPIFNQALDQRAVRLVGVSVSNLVRGVEQLGLFSDPRQRDLSGALDAINNKYGDFTIKRASLVETRAVPKSHGFDGKQEIHEQLVA